jgi:hypothetical protein
VRRSRITVATNALRCACNLGGAYPRQPISSPIAELKGKVRRRTKGSKGDGLQSDAGGGARDQPGTAI